MNKLYYCPKCGKREITGEPRYQKELTITNMRDGYGMPIHHYKCECGNYLAGSMILRDGSEDEIKYYTYLIEAYNPGGDYYDGMLCRADDFLESAKLAYEDKKSRTK